MPRGHRLSALDASFLHLETGGAHMHVAGVMTFEGEPPSYDEFVHALESRMHLVPRYRQRLAEVPLAQGRPVWVDDPHFNIHYHVRHAALPSPGTDTELKRLAGRVFAQALDRAKPLWEVLLVEGLDGDRFALISKTHHALVDGVSGVDLTSVLFDATPEPPPAPSPSRGIRAPSPPAPSCSPMRWSSARPCPPRPRAASALSPARRARRSARSATASPGSARWPGPA